MLLSVSSYIPNIRNFNNYVVNKNRANSYSDVVLSAPLEKDVFEHSNTNVSFCSEVNPSENTFRIRFPRSFFNKLVAEGLPCAYTGVDMLPRKVYDNLKNSQDLQKRSSVSVKALKPYRAYMFPIEKKVFKMLENESKKHPNLKLQDLLQLKFPEAEKVLVQKQISVLGNISMLSRSYSKNDFLKTRKLVNEYFDKIYSQEPTGEDRFRRKDFIMALQNLDIKSEHLKTRMLEIANDLPQSSDSIHAFIVKYAQPDKIKYVDGQKVKSPRDSEELGLRFIKPAIATDEHIYPQTLYRMEEQARQNGDEEAKKLSTLRVTILTCDYINNIKGDMLIDDLIRSSKYDIPGNIQKHVDRLIEIDEKWLKNGNIQDAATLSDYIMVLKEEFERRSEIVRIDTSKLEEKLPEIQEKTKNYIQKIEEKRKRRDDKASNSHSEVYINPDGSIVENRKFQVHAHRFTK